MKENNNKNFLVVGIGNAFRGDDALGLLIARFLKRYFAGRVKIVEVDISFDELIQTWGKFQLVIIIDAVKSESDEIGKVYRFELWEAEIPSKLEFFSTHALGVAEYINLAKVLGNLPAKVIIYGIVGKHFNFGDPISPEVKSSCREVIKQILCDCEVR